MTSALFLVLGLRGVSFVLGLAQRAGAERGDYVLEVV